MRSPEVSPSSLDAVIAPVICWQKRGTEKIWRLGKTSTPPHQGGGIATRPVSRHLRKRHWGKRKIATFVRLSVHLHRVPVLLPWRTAAFVGSTPTFRTRGAQTPRFRSGVPQYAVAVRRSTGFCSFSPAPVGIQAGQSPFDGRCGLGSRAARIRGISSIGRAGRS